MRSNTINIRYPLGAFTSQPFDLYTKCTSDSEGHCYSHDSYLKFGLIFPTVRRERHKGIPLNVHMHTSTNTHSYAGIIYAYLHSYMYIIQYTHTHSKSNYRKVHFLRIKYSNWGEGVCTIIILCSNSWHIENMLYLVSNIVFTIR